MSSKTQARMRMKKLNAKRKKKPAVTKVQKKKSDQQFERMRQFTNSMGISDQLLKSMMAKTKGDTGATLDALGINKKFKDGFGSDHLFGDVPRAYNSKEGYSSFRDFRVEEEADLFRPVVRRQDLASRSVRGNSGQLFPAGSDLLLSNKKKRATLDDVINAIQGNTPRQADVPYTFPDTGEPFNMIDAIQTSIANYKKQKNLFGSKPQYSNISNQL